MNSEPNTKLNPTPKDLFLSFLRLGLTAFGGPAMVAYIREMAVNRKELLDEETFKNGVALCQSIPGATAIQAAAYVGLRTRGVVGALASYIGFALPAFFFMFILSSLYAASHSLPWVLSLFAGLQVIVVALIANATYTFGRTTLKSIIDACLAAATALAFYKGISPFYVVLGTALVGMALLKTKIPEAPARTEQTFTVPVSHIALLLLLAIAGFACLYFFNTKLFTLAALMLKVDLFAFGGGFASIPLMLHEIVNVQGWMDSKTFMDGIALGQVTPGPIVITATFVGYLTHGFAGAIVATIAIFTPSFIVLVATAPFFDTLKQSRLFMKAVRGILASFVGLLLFVTIKFAFAIPWDAVRILLAVAAFIAVLKKVDILYIVPIGAAISIILLR